MSVLVWLVRIAEKARNARNFVSAPKENNALVCPVIDSYVPQRDKCQD